MIGCKHNARTTTDKLTGFKVTLMVGNDRHLGKTDEEQVRAAGAELHEGEKHKTQVKSESQKK